jgi:hypothetical protein
MKSDVGVVVWNGCKDGPGGALLGDYGPPAPPKPKEWLVLPNPKVAVQARPTRKPNPRVMRAERPLRHAGPVFYARPKIWHLLASPVSIGDIEAAVGGLPRRALKSAVDLLRRGGAVMEAGYRENPFRRSGIKRVTKLYQRTPAYLDVPTWPTVRRASLR